MPHEDATDTQVAAGQTNGDADSGEATTEGGTELNAGNVGNQQDRAEDLESVKSVPREGSTMGDDSDSTSDNGAVPASIVADAVSGSAGSVLEASNTGTEV